MNNIIEIAGLLFMTSLLVFVVSVIASFFDDIDGRKSKNKTIAIISSITTMLSVIIMIIYSIKNPQPTFREVCEANNGIYIDNNGRAGDSCIYNK